MMKSLQTTLRFFAAVLFSIPFQLSTAQPYVINGIDYKQISSFETNYGISTMKISSDGSKIVFATGGAEVKVYTISTDGSGLTMIYDFERTGSAPMVDITANGEGVIWCDGEGEIFIAKSNGTDRLELATLLPDPDPNRDFIEPIIPLPPRLTYDGSEVYFIHMDRDPMASGVYKINSDNSGLELKFNYLDMAEDLFGTDGSEYNQNVAFADGFDISSYGNRILVGTRIFRLAEGDVGRGDAIGYDGADFFNLGEYATGTQPFSTDQDGNQVAMFKREYNDDLGYDEVNVYFVSFETGNQVKVIGGLDIFGTSRMTQMTHVGNQAIVQGENGRLPISLVTRSDASSLDLVSIDGVSLAMGGYRFSESHLPSISGDGRNFSFLSTSTIPQIWVASIKDVPITVHPAILDIGFDPEFVPIDGSATSTFSARVFDEQHGIHAVAFETFKEGVFKFRALRADYPYSGRLVDDGTLGDIAANNGIYTNGTVRADLPETPLGNYTIRFAAASGTLKEVSMVEAWPFEIVEPSTSNFAQSAIPGFKLHQNYPNPFGSTSSIGFEIPEECQVELKVYSVLGKFVAELVDEKLNRGRHSVEFDAKELPAGLYLYSIQAGKYHKIRKMQVLD